ncbi:hypothetical protein BDY19DRAFT_1010558 [Irpex rosettiformis]|uniref:Uncharacterized protein n=1 Tax=Irpex rosettiformis TaxID=378272 RepID=A0ACB8U0P0_9APHY|nr:hypothetical protein BDY19DRAFT_1010558 [Irpex rosettiformis]
MPMIPTNLPPADGSLTVVPGFIDYHAEHNPDRPWAIFPSDTSPAEATSISFGEFARATHRVAYHVRPVCKGTEREVVGIIVHTDAILYMAVIAGLMRAGITPLPMSPKISPEAIANLLKKTSSHRVITQDAFLPTLKALQSQLAGEEYSLTIDNLIPLDAAFPTLKLGTDVGGLPEGPYPKDSQEPGMDDIVMYSHSSGSTGLPKPVPLTRRIQLQWATSNLLWETRKRGVQWASMIYLTFHMTGLYMQFIHPLVSGQAVGLYAPQSPAPPPVPTADSAIEVCRITKCNAIAAVPTFVEHWAQSDDHVNFLSTLESLTFSGGPLSAKSGAKLIKAGVSLYSIYGITECGAHSMNFDADDSQGPDALCKTSADWDWFQFSDAVKPRFVPQSDGKYELHYLTCETHHPSVENLPDVKGYATSDLFIPHPTKKGLWKIVGRIDDVIVLATGENVVPIPQEGHLVANTLIAGAVMFGRGRDFPGVLIEPHAAHTVDASDESLVQEFIDKIWPIVEEANKIAMAYGRISKNMIIITSRDRPLPRAAKGTIVRKQAIELYNDDIEKLYSSASGIIRGENFKQATSTLHTNIFDKA